jgi:hypothetical protein
VSRTTLLVPVLDAEPATAGWWPEWEPPKARGIPAHVSVLFPFLHRPEIGDEQLALLAEAAGAVQPFDFALTSIGRFPQTVYLAPRPATGFTELTRGVEERFPGMRAYGGIHVRHVPHLTVLTCTDQRLLDRAAAEVGMSLPIRSRATHMWLMAEREHGGWERVRSFPLGRE